MNVLESIAPVVLDSQYVSIDRRKIKEIAANYNLRINPCIGHWINHSPLFKDHLTDEQLTAFLFVFNAISFSYWCEKDAEKWAVEHQGHFYSRGTWSMIAALQRALQNGVLILDSNYLLQLETKDLGYILAGNITIPLLEERASILREVGQNISIKYNGSFLGVVNKKSQSNSDALSDDALSLVDRIVHEFPSFNDVSVYKGREVQFQKRAQLLVSDLSYQFKDKIKNAQRLTACADYILPMVLRYWGILKYVPELARKIDTQQEIQKDSPEEIEIRANTIWAVELIKKELNDKVTSMHVNDFLWLAGDSIPASEQYHRTRTTAY